MLLKSSFYNQKGPDVFGTQKATPFIEETYSMNGPTVLFDILYCTMENTGSLKYLAAEAYWASTGLRICCIFNECFSECICAYKSKTFPNLDQTILK